MHNIDTLLKQIDEAEEPPPLPPSLPIQWLPRWIRWALKVLILPFMLLDLSAQRLAIFLIRPPFKQTGQCLKRGKCCYYILIPENRGLLGKINYFWQTEVQGFYPRSTSLHEYEGKPVHVMGCRYLRKDGTCGQYHLRPMVCRKWPIIAHFGYPRILKGCGFKAVPRHPQPPPEAESPKPLHKKRAQDQDTV